MNSDDNSLLLYVLLIYSTQHNSFVQYLLSIPFVSHRWDPLSWPVKLSYRTSAHITLVRFMNQKGCTTVRPLWLSAPTNAVEDPAHRTVPTTGQHSEIGNITEEIEPRKRNMGSISMGCKQAQRIFQTMGHSRPTAHWFIIRPYDMAVFTGPWGFCNDSPFSC